MATVRARGRAGGNNVLLLLAIIALAFCAASAHMMMTNIDADVSAAAAKAAGLSVDFHAAGCPDLDGIVRTAVEEARRGDGQAVTAGLLRIFFHDCFPQGCDASLLLDKTQSGSEQNAPQNGGLPQVALNLVETIRGRVHGRCGAGSVSCADILALATSHAVKQAGGPFVPVELGRSDSRGPSLTVAAAKLPFPTANFESLNRSFTDRTLNAFDVVALSGAHTMGMARCATFQDRIDDGKKDKDNFEWGLTGFCNHDGGKKHAFDRTPAVFDNNYFVELQNGRGLLTSDQGLHRDSRTRWLVDRFASNQDAFFDAFRESMLKLSRLRGSDPGPVRNNCFRPNAPRVSSATNDDDLLVLETTAGAGAGDDDENLVLAAAA